MDEGWAKPDCKHRTDKKLNELATEDGEEEGDAFHLEDAGGELEELERGGRWKHGRNHDGEKFLTLETVADALIAFAVDAFQQKELAASTADKERNE